MRLSICVCTNRPAPPRFTLCIAQMLVALANDRGPFDGGLGFQMKANNSVLSIGRHSLVEASIKQGFTHILFIDDDSVFPPNAAHRLAAHNKRIVAVNFVKKTPEVRYCATGLDGNEVVSFGKHGLEEVLRVGFGMAMIDLDVFRKTPPPHFEVRWNGSAYTGEDYAFSTKVRESGEQLWVDHDLSALCGHIGDYVYAADPDFQSNMSA